jgi:hypothetical protein
LGRRTAARVESGEGYRPSTRTYNRQPSAPCEVSVSHTLARPAPQFTTLSGIGLITFPQISGSLVIR